MSGSKTSGSGSAPNGRPVLRHTLIATASLALVSLAFHPVDAWPLAYVAFVPWILYHQSAPRRGTKRALVVAYWLHFAALLAWTAEVTPLGPLLIPILGVPFVALAGFVLDRAIHRWKMPALLVYPTALITFEALRDQALGLTWSSVGYTQWRWLSGIQVASALRVHGVSFLVLLANVAIAGFILARVSRDHGRRRRASLALGLVLVLFGVVHAIGHWRISTLEFVPGPRSIGVQGNLSPYEVRRRSFVETWARQRALYLSLEASERDPDLLVFPETCFPNVVQGEIPLESRLASAFPEELVPGETLGGILPRGRGQITVIGYSRWKRLPPNTESPLDDDGNGFQEWNVAGFVRDGRTLVGECEKRIIVPFGEFIPYPQGFPFRDWLVRKAKDVGGFVPGLTAGTKRDQVKVPSPSGPITMSANICYEMVFPEETREVVASGADLVVNISNDGWFRQSAEADLVDVALRFRAIECRRTILRVTGTGITTAVDAAGRVLGVVEAGSRRKEIAGILKVDLPIHRGTSLYVTHGDLPLLIFPLAFLVGRVLQVFLTRRTPSVGRRVSGKVPEPGGN